MFESTSPILLWILSLFTPSLLPERKPEDAYKLNWEREWLIKG